MPQILVDHIVELNHTTGFALIGNHHDSTRRCLCHVSNNYNPLR